MNPYLKYLPHVGWLEEQVKYYRYRINFVHRVRLKWWQFRQRNKQYREHVIYDKFCEIFNARIIKLRQSCSHLNSENTQMDRFDDVWCNDTGYMKMRSRCQYCDKILSEILVATPHITIEDDKPIYFT